MDETKEVKKGLSIKEMEGFAKKHHLEVFFSIFFFLAGIFGLFLWHPAWSVILGAIGAIVGALLSTKIYHMSRGIWHFVFRQERNTRIVLAAIALVVAIFIPPLVFLFVGLHAGKSMHNTAKEASSGNKH